MSSLSDLGFDITRGWDAVSQRYVTMIANRPGERAWGAYIRDKAQLRLQLQVPHIKADNSTELMGLDIWRRVPGTLLLLSGTHRTDSTHTNPRDVAWQTGSMFHKVAVAYKSLPQVQIHGYANSSQPDFDVVVATGSAPTNDLAEAIAATLENDFRVARYWLGESDIYGAAGNKQSLAALASGSDFVHVEMNNTLRTTPALREKAVQLISQAIEDVL